MDIFFSHESVVTDSKGAIQRGAPWTLPEIFKHLKIDGWNTIVSFWGQAYFQGQCSFQGFIVDSSLNLQGDGPEIQVILLGRLG